MAPVFGKQFSRSRVHAERCALDFDHALEVAAFKREDFNAQF